MAFLHTGSNLLNDVFDYKKGIDKQVNPVSGAVVRGWITPREAIRGAMLFMAAGTIIGLYLVSRVGAPIFWIGLTGVLIGEMAKRYQYGLLVLRGAGMLFVVIGASFFLDAIG